MKYISTAILIVALLLASTSCSLLYGHEINAIGAFDVGYSKTLKDAFLGRYNWDDIESGMNIEIPEYYNNIKITGLGGYFGRGVPTAFEIVPTEKVRSTLCPNANNWSYANNTAGIDADNVQYLKFTLHISKYIEELVMPYAGGIIVAECVENEEIKYNVYVLTCYVTCDEDNETFYAKDGKLYFRENDVLVEDITYEDFDLDAHNEKYKDGITWFNSIAS